MFVAGQYGVKAKDCSAVKLTVFVRPGAMVPVLTTELLKSRPPWYVPCASAPNVMVTRVPFATAIEVRSAVVSFPLTVKLVAAGAGVVVGAGAGVAAGAVAGAGVG